MTSNLQGLLIYWSCKFDKFISYSACFSLYCKKIIIMMKKWGNLVINSLRTFIPISNVNSMSKMYCPSFRCIVLLQHRKQFKNSIYKEKCNNNCAFYALSLIIIPLYNNKCYLRALYQYWRILMYFNDNFKGLSNIYLPMYLYNPSKCSQW